MTTVSGIHAKYFTHIQIDIVNVLTDNDHVFSTSINDRYYAVPIFQVGGICLFIICQIEPQSCKTVSQTRHIFLATNMGNDICCQFFVFTHFVSFLQLSCI